MKMFRDATGTDWTFELNVYEFKRLRPIFGDLLDPAYFWEKTRDAVFLVDLLFALVEPKAIERKVDAETFARRFQGDAVDDARRVLTEEYVDFFPRRTRERMTAALVAIEEAQEAEAERQTEELRRKKAELAATRSATAPDVESPNGPDSPESTPTGER